MKAILGKKIGMTQVFKDNGEVVGITVFDVSENFVSKTGKTGEKNQYEIVKDNKKKGSKAETGIYKELNIIPRFKRTFTGREELTVEAGQKLGADIFALGEDVSVTGVTKGKGFAGVVKRWRFAGMPRTHGSSDRERAPGSLGSRAIPGRVFKGKKMGGHMGNRTKTVLGLKVEFIDTVNNLVGVKGAVPGARGTYAIIKSR
jgi:large subunit ribosomal protein L3